MKNFSLTFLFSTLAFLCFSQNIARDTALNIGFYRDLQELIDNNPSEPFDYKISERKVNSGGLFGDKVALFNLEIEKENSKLIGNIMGFSDGKNIYLKTIRTGFLAEFKSNKFNEKSNFIKIIDVGVYTFFYDLKNSTYYQPMMYNGGAMGGGFSVGVGLINSNKSYLPHIINTKTQEIIVLNTKQMKKLLADEPDLLKEFEADKNRKKNFEKYIIEYNSRFRSSN